MKVSLLKIGGSGVWHIGTYIQFLADSLSFPLYISVMNWRGEHA